VEVKVTKTAARLAVGVVSDEEQNGSGAMQPEKRRVLAGADVLIPDYHDAAALMKCMLGQ
jgi:hypothetical protein